MILYLNSNGDEEKKTPAKKINDQPVVVLLNINTAIGWKIDFWISNEK